MRRAVIAVLFALLVPLAGCGTSPTQQPSTVTAPSPSQTSAGPTATTPVENATATVDVYGAPLPVDATRVWRRVQRLHGTNASPPRIYVRQRAEPPISNAVGFQRVLGMNTSGPPGFVTGPGGRVYPGSRTVYLALGNGSPAEVETVLAHEYAHSLQRTYGLEGRGTVGVDAMVAASVSEGAATYVEAVYAQQYTTRSPLADLRRRYRNATPFQRLWLAPYYLGARYVAEQVTSPRGLARLYRTPPTTTEQVLHDLGPGEEPAAPLSVQVVTNGSDWVETERATKGELYLRIALQTELERTRSRRVAAGWGNDSLVQFVGSQNGTPAQGYAWVLQWDTPADARAFAAAFDVWQRRRDGNPGLAFRTVRVNAKTVVVFAGDSVFTSHVEAVATGDSVRITA